MRIRFVLLVLLLAAAIAAMQPATPTAADCAAPTLDLAPQASLLRGEKVTVTGRHFRDGCNDTGVCTGFLGCQRCDYGPPVEPMRDVELVLRQAGRSWSLGSVDADATYVATWTFELPPNVRPGRARLVPTTGEPARVTIR
jgi:hypothetical protein